MALEGETKMYSSSGRHSIYVPARLVNDSVFPFKLGEKLMIRIEENRVVVEKAKKPSKD